ncbi:Oidioi.mRNA.OKI2018_I69.XSR.g16622.t1.cds [Oikopleura dioica]|uniref:Oidioi.mRNA.OKI2018_I69.XSR.g16622.t1.cds n=1 Tax=Oikopleura dioica TaxID=34765 RepID=A0ABN7SGP8_OIKDI|nr:Oidioi.mRNA.OKI2018_I69.XSR.g16622.t1.cds [Oikopleura dioica]
MKVLAAVVSAASAVEVANDAWTQVAAAYGDLYDAVYAAYVDRNFRDHNARKKANRLRDFYNKVENFPGRVSDSCVEFAGSGDPDAFVPPYYDSPDYGAPGDRTFLLMREPNGNRIHFVVNHPTNSPSWAHQIYTDIVCTDGQWSTYTVEVTDAGNGNVNYVASVDGSTVMSGSYAAGGSKSTGDLTAHVADNYQVGPASAYRVRNFFYQTL